MVVCPLYCFIQELPYLLKYFFPLGFFSMGIFLPSLLGLGMLAF